MKRVLSVLTCVLLLSLSGCGAGSAETSGGSEPNEASESGVSADVSENTETSEPDVSSEQETASGPAVKVLAKEYIHRTDQDGQVSSYRAPIYTESALYDGFERYTPDDILLEIVDECTYEIDEAGNIVRREDAYGAWTEFTYDDEGYPLTSISYDQDGEKYDEWSSFEYEEVDVESLPEFMGSAKQWILADLVY